MNKKKPEALPNVPRTKPLTLEDLEIKIEDLEIVRGGAQGETGPRRDIGPRE